MNFLNVALLGGAAALLVPLIIHLLNRSRFKKVQWGAMHLLDTVVASNSRRIRLEQLLLLLIRCAIPVMLAFCLARPVFTRWQTLAGDAPSSTVLLLDNSYSMDAPGQEATRWDETIQDAKAIVDQLAQGSDVAVLATGGRPDPLFDTALFDPAAVSDALGFMTSGRAATDWVASLEAGVGLVSNMANSRRDLIWISDFQRTDLDRLTPDQVERLQKQLDGLAVPVHLTMIQRSGPEFDNVSIESVELSAPAVGVGQSVSVRVGMKNHSNRNFSEVRVSLKVDDLLVSVSEIDIAAMATSQTLFTHQFKESGSKIVEVEIDAGDALATDNRYVSTLQVIDQIEVLLVDGDISREPMQSETDFLSVALTPFALGRLQLSDLVTTRIAKSGELSEELLAWPRVVILANVSQLESKPLDALERFVRDGGSLLVFMGDKVRPNWYNDELFANRGLLPMALNGRGETAQDQRPARIVAQFFEHPALQMFNEGQAELAGAEIHRWTIFEEPETTDQQGQANVMMRLDTGAPLVVESTVGSGVVQMVATSADADWTNLPLRPVFVPLVQQLVTDMATRTIPQTNLSVSDSVVAYYDEDSRDKAGVIALPENREVSVRAAADANRSVIRYSDTIQPGIYSLTGPDGRTNHYAVESDRGESDTEVASLERVKELATQLNAELVQDAGEYLTLESRRRHGREVWRYALAGLLLLMFLEMFFQQRFARVRA